MHRSARRHCVWDSSTACQWVFSPVGQICHHSKTWRRVNKRSGTTCTGNKHSIWFGKPNLERTHYYIQIIDIHLHQIVRESEIEGDNSTQVNRYTTNQCMSMQMGFRAESPLISDRAERVETFANRSSTSYSDDPSLHRSSRDALLWLQGGPPSSEQKSSY